MMRLVLSAPAKIIPKLFDHGRPERKLLGFRKILAKTSIIRKRLRGDRLHKRHEFFPQLRKHRPHAGRFHPVIGKINQRIGNVIVTGKKVRQLATVIECLLQGRPHRRKIIRRSRLAPRFVGRGLMCAEFRDE